ncbi:hydroxymethylglutaryl-CoA lyase [Paraburkholderia fungorum]|uniref:hydroxymethylglutaryl-CoA lyase n=1 Tax=Paraburkholderia fungorum TaxID=134537 RepID=UPI0038BB53DF
MNETMHTGRLPIHDRRVEVTEVGMRDGLQIETTFVPTQRKIELINDMIEAGIRHIEVTSFVSPKAVPQLADAEQVLAGIARRPDTCLSALVPNLRAAERAAGTSINRAVLLCSASDTHNRKNLNRGVDDTLAALPRIAALMAAQRIGMYGAIATAFGCPFEGDIALDQVVRIGRAFRDAGATVLVVSDTTGMATPLNLRRVIGALRDALPDVELALHLHNTRGIGLANVLVGLEEGIRRFDSSVGGLGGCPFAPGATGNISTEDLLFLLDESGYETGVDLNQVIDVALKMERILGKRLQGQVMRAGPRLRLHETNAVATAAG